MEKMYLTAAGYKALEEELEDLEVNRRREVAEKIKIAREYGDISENSEYDSAKEEQAMIEGRILEIRARLAGSEIIAETNDTSMVTMGSEIDVVVINDKGASKEEHYVLVGSSEADPFTKHISNESLMGRALIGRRVGDKISVQTLGGMLQLEIKDIQKRGTNE